MGAALSSNDDNLTNAFGASHLAVFDAKYCSETIKILNIKERMFLKADSFDVFNSPDGNANSGSVAFKVHGNLFNFVTEPKTLKNGSDDEVIANMKKKFFTIRTTYEVSDANDRKLFEISRPFKIVRITEKINIKNVPLLDGGNRSFVLESDITRWSAKIYTADTKDIIAKIDRKLSSSLIVGADTYMMTVAPGVDQAFVVMLMLAFDEIAHEDDNQIIGSGGDGAANTTAKKKRTTTAAVRTHTRKSPARKRKSPARKRKSPARKLQQR